MRDVFFVSAGDVQTRLGVTVLGGTGVPLNAVESDHDGALRVLVDIPAGFALPVLEGTPRSVCNRTLVVTGNPSVLYADALRSYGVLSVIGLQDSHSLVTAKLEGALSGERAERPYEFLSVTETRVLRLLLAGAPGTEIAEALRISVKTVTAHVSNVMRRVGVRDRATLVARVLGGTA